MLPYLSRSQGEMRAFFGGRDVAFLLVSSPEADALDEAFFFEEQTRALSLPLAGYVLNRSRAWRRTLPQPGEVALPADASDAVRAVRASLGLEAEAA